MVATSFSRQLRTAERHLAGVNPTLARLITTVGPCTLERSTDFEPFHALLSSIAHQQLNGKAAMTILGRVKDRFADGGWPTPKRIAGARVPSLRACGLSNAKSLAVKDLAAKTLEGTVPTARALEKMSDDAIVEALTEVRGIGRWTVEMMLMFRLGRLDVMPVDDFGVRKGYSQLFGLKEMVKPKVLMSLSEPWRPYRSVGAWYMWRVLDV